MILLFSNKLSPRLQYICTFIFRDLMNVAFNLTTSEEELDSFEGVKIIYSNTVFRETVINLRHHPLLFEEDISEQTIDCFEINGAKAFFKIDHSDLPFDIFAASFYLLSRYEEYLPHKKDMYGRYAHENSIAFKKNFLHQPLINIWVNQFIKKIQNKYSTSNIQHPTSNIIPTYDIDIAYSYKCKGIFRNAGGFLKSPTLERIRVLFGLQKDPYDCYDWLDELHQKYDIRPLYFFLVAEKNSVYDKNILPKQKSLQNLITRHSERYNIGIHPGWKSGDDFALLKNEIAVLENISHKKPINSRQHYIRFNLPEGYQRLISAGITDDYSMGYGSINGFRASVASPFFWYDLKKEEQTTLKIHPFCFMEANSFYEQKFTAEQAFNELMDYYLICKENSGTMITIWHNHFLGTDPLLKGWKDMYEKFIQNISAIQ